MCGATERLMVQPILINQHTDFFMHIKNIFDPVAGSAHFTSPTGGTNPTKR
jgi:hypothetical protein